MPQGRGGRELHADELQELIEREKKHKAPPVSSCYTYADALLELKLIAGPEGINAVLRDYTDKIAEHEVVLKRMRSKKADARVARRTLKAQADIAREAYSAYVTIMNDAGDLDEEDMDAVSHVAFIVDKNMKLQKAGRQKEVVPVPTVEEVQEKIDARKALKERIQRLYTVAMLEKKKEEELKRESADCYSLYAKEVRAEAAARAQVSSQHRVAKKRGVTLMSLYPKAHIWDGMVSVNDIRVWGLPFKDITELLEDEAPPHRIEWGRHDYREDVFGHWFSFEQLRAAGKYVPEPERYDEAFIQACAARDLDVIEDMLHHGHALRINRTDCIGSSAIHAAVANGHKDVIELLLENGADPQLPNAKGYSPWLMCICRGDLELVELFEEFANDINTAVDGHSVLCRAIMACKAKDDMALVNYVISKGASLLYINRTWNWTMLHYAARLGNVDFVKLVLKAGVSAYFPSKMGTTAAMLAEDAGHEEVVELLRQHIFGEPAQLIGKFYDGEIWVGSREAAKRRWAEARGIDAVCSIKEDPGYGYTGLSWLDDDDTVENLAVWCVEDDVAAGPGGDAGKGSLTWKALTKVLLRAHNFIHQCLKREPGSHKPARNVLIHCDEGKSTSIAVLCHYLMTKGRMRYSEALRMIKKIRPCTHILPELEKALLAFEDERDRRQDRIKMAQLKDSVMVSLGFNPLRHKQGQ